MLTDELAEKAEKLRAWLDAYHGFVQLAAGAIAYEQGAALVEDAVNRLTEQEAKRLLVVKVFADGLDLHEATERAQFPTSTGSMRQPDHDALAERYARLRVAAQAVVDGAEALGTPKRPLCGLEPHLLRDLRRELDDEPRPHGMWMSIS